MYLLFQGGNHIEPHGNVSTPFPVILLSPLQLLHF